MRPAPIRPISRSRMVSRLSSIRMVNTTTASAVASGCMNGLTNSISAPNGGRRFDDRQRRLARRRLLVQVLDRLGRLGQVARARRAQLVDLLRDVVAVLGQLGGERQRLVGRQRADRAEDRAARDHRDEGRGDAPQVPALEAQHDRRQHEAEQDGERERDQHLARQVQHRHHDHQREHRGRARAAWERGWRDCAQISSRSSSERPVTS